MKRTNNKFIITVLLIAVTLIVYSQVWNHEFILLDSDFYIYDNPRVQKGLTADGLGWAFSFNETSYLHPLT